MKFSSRDLVITIAVALLAGLLRFWNLQHLGLTHFDEGAYAMGGRWLATLGTEGHVLQPTHSPALVPLLVAGFFQLFGVEDYVAVAVSATAGTLAVGLLYLIGAKWFNRSTGLVAALFLATAEYHLIYSRMILTDSVFTLLFWAALFALFTGLQNEDYRWVLAGGVLTALCWNTKYHGFLPLVFVAGWVLIQRWIRPLDRYPGGGMWWLCGAAALACLGFLPWIIFVAFTTGWSEILIGQWQHSLGGGWPRTSPLTLWFYLVRWLSPPLLALAMGGLAVALLGRRAEAHFAAMTGAVFAGLALFYSNFPRLILPVIPAICLLAAWCIDRASHRFSGAIAPTALLSLCGVLTLGWNLLDARDLLQLRTDAYRQAARYLQGFDPPVLTQMSKNFYFYETGDSTEMRRRSLPELDELAAKRSALIVAVDPLLRRLTPYHEWFQAKRQRMELLKTFEIQMYEPVFYQGVDPRAGLRNLPRSVAPFVPGESRIEVFRYRIQAD